MNIKNKKINKVLYMKMMRQCVNIHIALGSYESKFPHFLARRFTNNLWNRPNSVLYPKRRNILDWQEHENLMNGHSLCFLCGMSILYPLLWEYLSRGGFPRWKMCGVTSDYSSLNAVYPQPLGIRAKYIKQTVIISSSFASDQLLGHKQ